MSASNTGAADRAARQLAKPQPERITRQQQAEKQSAWLKALHDYYANPFWAEDLPLPPDIDFKAIAEEDMKLIVLMLAVRKVADQRGISMAAQLDAWNYGRGEQ